MVEVTVIINTFIAVKVVSFIAIVMDFIKEVVMVTVFNWRNSVIVKNINYFTIVTIITIIMASTIITDSKTIVIVLSFIFVSKAIKPVIIVIEQH